MSQSGNGGFLEHMTSRVIILFFVTFRLSYSPATAFIPLFLSPPGLVALASTHQTGLATCDSLPNFWDMIRMFFGNDL